MQDHLDTVKFLTVEKQCDSMLRNTKCNTALHCAVMGGHLQTVKFFIEELKCSPDIRGQQNMTPVQLAAYNDHREIAQYLLKYSKNISILVYRKRITIK